MVTTRQTQRTYWSAAAEEDLNQQVDAFLLDRRIRGLASGTLGFFVKSWFCSKISARIKV